MSHTHIYIYTYMCVCVCVRVYFIYTHTSQQLGLGLSHSVSRYPFPLMPAHFLDWSIKDQKDAPWWPRYCPNPSKPCPMQTMRWVAWRRFGGGAWGWGRRFGGRPLFGFMG